MSSIRSILLVEDDRAFVDDLLASWSPAAEVRCAYSGEEAVHRIENDSPEFVLLDLNLPRFLAETDGEEGLRILQRIRGGKEARIPVIVLTRDGSPETRGGALALGADAFLVKPIRVEELVRAVASLGQARATRSAESDRSGDPEPHRPLPRNRSAL